MGALVATGCIVGEGDKACGKDQILVEAEGLRYCGCAAGFILDDASDTCVACGENEEVAQNKCVCQQGYTRPSEGAACMMSALGNPCSDDSACGGDFPACADGYCTSNCASSKDCQPGWVCDEVSGSKVCTKPPTGYGKMCDTSDECAGTEATFCEAFRSHTCQVSCSQSSPCPGDWGCCDFSVMVICLDPSALVDGACPTGGKLVTP